MKTLQDPTTGRFLPSGPNKTVTMPDNRLGIVIVQRSGVTHMTTVDAADYPKVKDIHWCVVIPTEGHPRCTPYVRATVRGSDGKRHTVRMHQLIAGGPGLTVDHIDMNGLWNVRENLRVCSATGNNCNRRANRNNKCGVKGVHQRKDSGKWRWQIGLGYKQVARGDCDTKEEAAAKYDEACLLYHGSYARPNELPVR